MSTPNPVPASAALVAASPILKQVIADLKTALNTTLVGDAMQIPLRAGPAFGIFLNQLSLLEPSLASAEAGAVNLDLQSRLDALAAKLP